MVHNKRKKFSRMRASHTHGGGAKKKRRGAGHRGGRGNAGLGKKGDARKTLIWKDVRHLGKHGFHSLHTTRFKTLNLNQLEEMIPSLLRRKIVESKNGMIIINLPAGGYSKLLGSGTVKSKLEITAEYASESAVKKVEAAGGKVILTKKNTEKAEVAE